METIASCMPLCGDLESGAVEEAQTRKSKNLAAPTTEALIYTCLAS